MFVGLFSLPVGLGWLVWFGSVGLADWVWLVLLIWFGSVGLADLVWLVLLIWFGWLVSLIWLVGWLVWLVGLRCAGLRWVALGCLVGWWFGLFTFGV